MAALGHFWSPNEERGVFRTTDGGESWEQVLFVSRTYRVRWTWSWTLRIPDPLRFGLGGGERGAGGGRGGKRDLPEHRWRGVLGRSSAGGLPEGPLGRIGLDVAPVSAERGLCLRGQLEPKPGWRTGTSSGERSTGPTTGEISWRKVNEDDLFDVFGVYGWKFTDIRVSPDDADDLFILGNRAFHSTDGGRTFQRIGEKIIRMHDTRGVIMHLDHHEIWIDPLNPDRVLLGNDGGLYQSWDRGETWLHHNNIPAAEFYSISLDMSEPYRIFGGTQDNAALYGPSHIAIEDAIRDPWENVYLDQWTGGDSFDTYPDPTDPAFVYYEHQHGAMRRMDITQDSVLTGAAESIRPRAERGIVKRGRWQSGWYTPFIISHYDPSTLLLGGNQAPEIHGPGRGLGSDQPGPFRSSRQGPGALFPSGPSP